MLTFEVDYSGIKDLEKYLNDIPKILEERVNELVKRLCERGVTVAQAYFDEAPVSGPRDVSVSWTSEGKGVGKITAFGDTVLFIEFGTGITMPDSPESRADLISGDVLQHGEYGGKHGADPRGWFYSASKGLGKNTPLGTEMSEKYPGKIHTYGMPAYPAMYMTKKELEEEFESIAREVFK